nr:MAG TPA: hypothetical protein [Caudoviricetes sp.]
MICQHFFEIFLNFFQKIKTYIIYACVCVCLTKLVFPNPVTLCPSAFQPYAYNWHTRQT